MDTYFTNPGTPPEYGDIDRLVDEMARDQHEFAADLAADGEEWLCIWAHMFPEPCEARVREDFRTENIQDIKDMIRDILSDRGDLYRSMLVSLVDLFAEIWGNDEDAWFMDRAFAYLETARAEGAVDEKKYQKIKKNLTKRQQPPKRGLFR